MPGTGKTTLLTAIIEGWRARGRNIVLQTVASEPGDVFQAKTEGRLSAREGDEWHLRTQRSLAEERARKLAAGATVISDRGCISLLSFAYARSAMNREWRDYEWLGQRYFASPQFFDPDSAVILLVDVDKALTRKQQQQQFAAAGPWLERDFVAGMKKFYSDEMPRLFPHLPRLVIELGGGDRQQAKYRLEGALENAMRLSFETTRRHRRAERA
jgi:thymidylate kinase